MSTKAAIGATATAAMEMMDAAIQSVVSCGEASKCVLGDTFMWKTFAV
jgi:hypothetical protein